MFDCKTFTFCCSQRIKASAFSKIIEKPYLPVLTFNGVNVRPTLKFSCTNSEINALDSDNLLNGWFVELFQCLGYEIKKEEEFIVINTTFILQFDTDIPVSLKDNEIVYSEDGEKVYSYKIDPSFGKEGYGPFDEYVEIDSDNELTIEEAIKEYVMP